MNNSKSNSRQLACIMFTDIVGYTALMGEDENLALSVLEKNRKIQWPIIESYGGTIIKELGDGLLATFYSATDSVLAAASIQLAVKNEKHLTLRIGLHLSEVIFENNDVFGDGVNIASRIESSAPVGSIYISEAVQKNLSNKKGIETKYIGIKEYKNVKNPIPIYELVITDEFIAQPTPTRAYVGHTAKTEEKSIAILPFENVIKDPEQEYFSDGMAEEILNALSNIKDLKVMSRSSSFQFKGQDKNLAEIAKQLNVGKILVGSVRRQNNRVRVTAQLINTRDDSQIWSEKYDREMTDIFEVQDEIALAITQKLKVTLLQTEKEKFTKVPTENLEAYELYLKGQFYWNKRGRWLMNAFQCFQEAINLDPDFALAHAGMAETYAALGMYGLMPPLVAMPKCKESAQKAIDMNPDISHAYIALAFTNGFFENDRYLAQKNFKHALTLSPNNATGHYWYSFYLSIIEHDLISAEQEGLLAIMLEPHNAIAYHILSLSYVAQRKFDEAMAQAKKAIEIDAALFLPYFALGWCQIEVGKLKEAIETLTIALSLSGRHSWPMGFLILAKSLNGDTEEARTLLDEIINRDKEQYFSTFGSVIGAMALNETELALNFLEKGLVNRDILIPILTHFQVMPDNLKKDKQIHAFFKRIKLID